MENNEPGKLPEQASAKMDSDSEAELGLLSLHIESAPSVEISDLIRKEAIRIQQAANITISSVKNHLTGKIEESVINPAKFDEQFKMFAATGKALNPSTGAEVKSSKVIVVEQEGSEKAIKRELKKKRQKAGNPSQGDYMGPWAGYEGAQPEGGQQAELTDEQKTILKKLEEKRQKKIEELKDEENKPVSVQAKSVFHGNLGKDYQGRNFLDPPQDQKLGPHQCYIPKKCIHTWVGHSKGVQCVRIFPKFGHYILSGSYDTQIKLWDVMTNRKCVQTYMGHTEAVRDLCFSNDGKKFLSASFDRNVILWDTEYGKAIRAFTNKKIPYCVKFHPEDSKQNLFMVGSQAKKIMQYDVNSGEVVLQYEEHTGSVNTLIGSSYPLETIRRFICGNSEFLLF